MAIDNELEEERPEEELDLVDLMKRVESNFNQGITDSGIYNKSPEESIRDYQEFN